MSRYGVLRVLRPARAVDSSAVIPAGKHLFPFRTEKLSLPGPMVLGGQPPGRVGRRRLTSNEPALPARSRFARNASISGEEKRQARFACGLTFGSTRVASYTDSGGAAKPRLLRTALRRSQLVAPIRVESA